MCEDFEDGTEGWTFVDLGGLTSDWQIDTPANGDSTAALGHGYLPSDAAYDDWAISPSYDTSGLADGTATVSYYEYLNWSADATVIKKLRCLLYTSPSPRDRTRSRMPSSA